MKLKLFLKLAGSVFAIMLVDNAFAQEEKTLPPVTVTSTTNIDKAVTKSFNDAFKDAYNTQWYKVNKRYLVDFMMDDQKNKALLQKSGSIIYHIKYGHEDNLPEDIRKLVKSTYFDYNITSAINVKQENRDIWVINVESDKKLILVRVEEGDMEEVGNYNKS